MRHLCIFVMVTILLPSGCSGSPPPPSTPSNVEFFIAVTVSNPGCDVDAARAAFIESGPASAPSGTAWFPLRDLSYFGMTDDGSEMAADPVTYFERMLGLVVAPGDDRIYLLVHDTPTSRLTQAETT